MFERYLAGHIIRMTGLLLLALVGVTILYLTVLYTRTGNEQVSAALLLDLFVVHCSRYLPKLFSIAMFLATLLCYLRFKMERELLAMAVAGFGLTRHLRLIFSVMLACVFITSALVLFAGPRIEARYNDLRGRIHQAWADPDLLQPDRFYNTPRFSLYFGGRDATGALTDGVYTYMREGEDLLVIHAKWAELHPGDPGQALIYHQGTLHQFNGTSQTRINFQRYHLPLAWRQPRQRDLDTWSMLRLLQAGGGVHYAAIHKRIAPIVATLLLPLFALLLVCGDNYYRNPYGLVFIAITVFFVYYNLLDLARVLLRKEVLPSIIVESR